MSSGAEGKERSRRWRLLLWGLLFVTGAAGWLLFLGGHEADRAWRALLVNFLYFTPLAGGLATWSAIVLAANGTWPGTLERIPLAGAGFAVPSLLALLALWGGSSEWAPWFGKTFGQGIWFDNTFLFGRDMAALLLFWCLVLQYRARRRRNEGKSLAGWVVLVYCLVFTLLGFDLVMALDPEWHSALAGGYFFISGTYIAVSAWALLAAARGDTAENGLHDLGKLVLAFAILTTYMMYSQLLPIWYENLPHETRFLLPRLSWPWQGVSSFLLAVAWLGPLLLLLTIRAKRSRWRLGATALLILVSMWVERWWLVAPHFHPEPRFGWIEATSTVASFALFAISAELALARRPAAAGGERR